MRSHDSCQVEIILTFTTSSDQIPLPFPYDLRFPPEEWSEHQVNPCVAIRLQQIKLYHLKKSLLAETSLTDYVLSFIHQQLKIHQMIGFG